MVSTANAQVDEGQGVQDGERTAETRARERGGDSEECWRPGRAGRAGRDTETGGDAGARRVGQRRPSGQQTAAFPTKKEYENVRPTGERMGGQRGRSVSAGMAAGRRREAWRRGDLGCSHVRDAWSVEGAAIPPLPPSLQHLCLLPLQSPETTMNRHPTILAGYLSHAKSVTAWTAGCAACASYSAIGSPTSRRSFGRPLRARTCPQPRHPPRHQDDRAVDGRGRHLSLPLKVCLLRLMLHIPRLATVRRRLELAAGRLGRARISAFSAMAPPL